jgi:uncharacterized surface protein with fasciclin (FAS1) repeats
MGNPSPPRTADPISLIFSQPKLSICKMKFSLTLALASFGSFAIAQEMAADIPTTAVAAGSFTTLVAALGAADLVPALSAPEGPFTVFAPTDDAFAALPEGLVECLLEPANSGALTAILTYHVVTGTVLSTDLVDGMMPATLQGEAITIDLSSGVTINDSASVVTADVLASNGVIHVIDSVLVPPSIDVTAFIETSCVTMEHQETGSGSSGGKKGSASQSASGKGGKGSKKSSTRGYSIDASPTMYDYGY